MAKPQLVGLGDWNEMVTQFHGESDRGSAVLAGSFTEHALGTFLDYVVANKKLAEKLFGPVGPLSSFSQRIAVSYAFGKINQSQYEDFEAIRQTRNYFAHHPLDASFESAEVGKLLAKTSIYTDPALNLAGQPQRVKNRIVYLVTCGMLCGMLLDRVNGRSVPALHK